MSAVIACAERFDQYSFTNRRFVKTEQLLSSSDWLNFHHLRYFWAVAREGNLRRAAEKLHVSQPSISAQIKILESALGDRLFRRSGRTLVLTEFGRLIQG